MKKPPDLYDVLIVGGGAAGLFCAAHLSGLRVAVLEKRERPARKLLMTGKGRCNLTNDCTRDEFLAAVARNPRFLYSAFSALSPQDIMRFFEERGVPLKVERGRRVFPASDSARDIVDALVNAARAAGADILTGEAESLLLEDGADGVRRVQGVRLSGGRELRAGATVIATGGMSFPATGSNGDGYRLAGEAGHTIVTPYPALTGLLTEPAYPQAAGLSLRNVNFTLFDRYKKCWSEVGEALFTHTGLSGPLALTASSLMDAARPKDYRIEIDLKPGLDSQALDRRILRDFSEAPNRDFGKSLGALLPRSLCPIVVDLCGVPPQRKVHEITREQRGALCAVIKAFPLAVRGLGSFEEAVITRGGVCVREVDPGSMRSKRAPGLFFAGEVLDVDALTGGYNLQIAFSTAYLAARSIRTAQDEGDCS